MVGKAHTVPKYKPSDYGIMVQFFRTNQISPQEAPFLVGDAEKLATVLLGTAEKAPKGVDLGDWVSRNLTIDPSGPDFGTKRTNEAMHMLAAWKSIVHRDWNENNGLSSTNAGKSSLTVALQRASLYLKADGGQFGGPNVPFEVRTLANFLLTQPVLDIKEAYIVRQSGWDQSKVRKVFHQLSVILETYSAGLDGKYKNHYHPSSKGTLTKKVTADSETHLQQLTQLFTQSSAKTSDLLAVLPPYLLKDLHERLVREQKK